MMMGRSVRAADAVGWLIDYTGPMEDALQTAWKVASGSDHGLQQRVVEAGALDGPPVPTVGLPPGTPETEAARKAIADCVDAACRVPLADALGTQAKHSAGFMVSKACRKGAIGDAFKKTMAV